MLELIQNNSTRYIALSRRAFSTALKSNKCEDRRLKMRAWQIHSYGELSELQLSQNARLPVIKSSEQCLVKVKSTSVNPLDVAMVDGYGAQVINIMRCKKDSIEFPLTLGREFSGVVVQKGMGQNDRLKVGDSVWGVVPPNLAGSHAEYVVVPEYCIAPKPRKLNNETAAGVLYAGLTAWSGLFVSGNLGGMCGALSGKGGHSSKNVLVLGAAGGVGSIAIQILKAENARVVATCSTDAVGLVQNLGADCVIDYTKEDELQRLDSFGGFDIVLDCAGKGSSYAEELKFPFSNYVTFSSPLLKNIDQSGIPIGIAKNIQNLIESNVKSFTTKRGCVKWGYFMPAPQGISYLQKLVERGKLLPVIDSVFKFEEMDKAYQKVQEGHLRGKVIVNVANDPE